ncbi:probable cytochrome P450 6a14 [Phlebotomus papatasi]|uniref:probable cytochrome P450 6a14 n=1 Tax=Phlebotomus papatasi TaxID=29031 RepID=UPI0024835CDE|nr:probable cytochrome P450 6a14 [Phlebotomus papatasi]
MDWNLIVWTVVTLLVAGYFYVKNKFKYWEKMGVPYVKPEFPFGILKEIGKTKHSSEVYTSAYKELKGKDVLGGIYYFTEPVAMITNLDLVKKILVKDFNYFQDSGAYLNEKDDPLSCQMFALSGPRWRSLRNKLSPTFTSGKMKMMHNTMVTVAVELQNYLEALADQKKTIEIRDIIARFTTDVIGNCAFGIECNSLKDPETEFRQIGRKVFESSYFGFLRNFFVMMFQDLSRMIKIKINRPEVTEFFMRVLKETTEYREKNNVKRNDFLSLLLQIKNTGKLEGDDTDLGKITFEELVAQTFLFFAAGFEGPSGAMTFSLYELARHQDIQDRARGEINKILVKYNGEYSYEACEEMKYLDQIINETLRMYPSLDSLFRQCVKDYQVPDSQHVIEKGTIVHVPIHSIQHDPEFYPNPENFDPDRFTEDNIRNRHHFAWLPFGEGPRNCIGKRFGLLQTKIGLAHMISKYRFRVCSKTSIPCILDPQSIVIAPKGGIWLAIEKV